MSILGWNDQSNVLVILFPEASLYVVFQSLFTMNFYESSFALLVSICGVLTWRQYHNGDESPENKSLTRGPITPHAKAEASKFTRLFLTVYCLVMASDWLQGSYSSSSLKHSF
jgi:hypothetical protein